MAQTTSSRDTILVLPPVDGVGALADGELLALQGELGRARRVVDARAAVIASEIARRSDRALGQQGLAARMGEPSAEKLLQRLTGVSVTDARALTAAGATLDAVQHGQAAWLSGVAEAVDQGHISVASAAAIAGGLGQPCETVMAAELFSAASALVSRATGGTGAIGATPEDLAKAARAARAGLDAASVVDMEQHRLSRRSLTWFETAEGMTRLSALLDPESAAIVVGALATALSPRRGGPRFVDSDEAARAQQMLDDPRTTEQLALDTLVDIVILATSAGDAYTAVANTPGSRAALSHARIFGRKSPAVRVHVTAEALEAGVGFAHLEGQSGLISIASAERHICLSGILPILFRGNTSIDVGRTQRLHSTRQRAALTAQWAGCAWTDCNRPPQFTEAHHIAPYDGENTTLGNGISLCRFHHMQLHANNWRIDLRADGTYWLTPPPGTPLHPAQLQPKSPLRNTG